MHRNKYTDVPKKGSRGICFGASPFILPTFILKTWGLMRARVLRTTISACVKCKVNLFWIGHKILQNLHRLFDWQYIGQIIGEDFPKFCGLLRLTIWTLPTFHQDLWQGCLKRKEFHITNRPQIYRPCSTPVWEISANLNNYFGLFTTHFFTNSTLLHIWKNLLFDLVPRYWIQRFEFQLRLDLKIHTEHM